MAGVVDMITGDSNRKAQKSADRASKGQEAIAKRITDLFDTMMGKVQGYENAGGFNPDKQLALADQQTSEARGTDMANDASTAKILGYRPGDTVPLDNLRAIDQKYKLKSEAQRYDIRQNAFGRLLNSYSALNPNSLMGAGQLYGNIQQNSLAQMKDPTDFFKTAAQVYATSQMG
jgi:hypothetical protein